MNSEEYQLSYYTLDIWITSNNIKRKIVYIINKNTKIILTEYF